MTPDEFKQRTEALISEWSSEFIPLYLAITELRRLMYIRIFQKSGGNLNTAGQQIPLPARKGASYNTPYSPGYTKIKERRPIPLELTGYLRRNFINESNDNPIIEQGLSAAIALNDIEYKKAQGLQYCKSVNPRYSSFGGYGVIFQPTEEEEKEFLELHTQLIINGINEYLGT
jgi:hypothetical protein